MIIRIVVLGAVVLGVTALLSANRAPNPALFDISGIPWVLPVVVVLLLFWSSVDKRLGDIEKKVDEKAEHNGFAPASPGERAHEACACERRR